MVDSPTDGARDDPEVGLDSEMPKPPAARKSTAATGFARLRVKKRRTVARPVDLQPRVDL